MSCLSRRSYDPVETEISHTYGRQDLLCLIPAAIFLPAQRVSRSSHIFVRTRHLDMNRIAEKFFLAAGVAVVVASVPTVSSYFEPTSTSMNHVPSSGTSP